MGSGREESAKDILGVLVDAVDYDEAVERILVAARERRGFAATALAVHGVMTAVRDRQHRYRLNRFDLVTADGQPVRWALRLLHGASLRERVYGPKLMQRLCEAAARNQIPIFLYGSRPEVLKRLVIALQNHYPDLIIAGSESSKFREVTLDERNAIARRIRESVAAITFVGLGCPRQEIFAYEFRDLLAMPVIAVGAAFDYHAGVRRQPPEFIQRAGLQWLYRLIQEPRRLWRRYLLLNPAFVLCLVLQILGLLPSSREEEVPPVDVRVA